MTYGKGLVSDGSMNRHKQMAQGKVDGGSAEKLKPGVVTQKYGMTGEISDGARGVSPAPGVHGQQASPDHGDMGKDHHYRAGKL